MKTCEKCGKQFQPKYHEDRARFCSIRCAAQANGQRRTRRFRKRVGMYRCRHCGQSFWPKDCGHRNRTVPIYCSRACRDAAVRKRVLLTCRQCGKEFCRKRYMKEWSQDRGPFCSMMCYGLWQRGKRLGPAATSPKTGPALDAARKAVLERDGHRCVRAHPEPGCGRRN